MTAPGTLPDHEQPAPSDWVRRWTHLMQPGGSVLDLACGHGRHMQWFARHGHPVLGVDRSEPAIAAAGRFGPTLLADIENGPWPLVHGGAPRLFDAVVVTNYLWRPLLPFILHSLAPRAVLIYETFAVGNETVGKPARPDFLLRHGELLQVCAGLRVVAYEDGFLARPDRFVQRIAALREPVQDALAQSPQRLAL